MKTLAEIIKLNEDLQTTILVENILMYKKSLLTYYNSLFCSDPVLMVCSVMNAAQYAKIVPADDLIENICAYLDNYNCMDQDNEDFCAYETIMFNSIMLSKL